MLLAVSIVAIAAIGVLFLSIFSGGTSMENNGLTGAAVKGQIATLCKDTDSSNPMKKGYVTVFFGSTYPDQCYGDEKAEKTPKNTGTYLKEYVCEDNTVSYKIYSCGTNKCQYSACVTNKYSLVE